MLENLKVLNGKLSPAYDKYNNLYTVKIESDIDKLDLIFEEDDNLQIFVYGNNNLKEGENKILISLTNKDETNYIYLTAITEEVKETMSTLNTSDLLETTNTMPIYGGPLIATSCFLLILTIFAFLFARRKKI